MRWTVFVIWAVAAPTLGAPSTTADCFDGILPAPTGQAAVQSEIGQVGWTLPCGDAGCFDCCDSACCSDGCGDACGLGCGGVCGSCRPPCCENCGLLGLGYLTYDPCGEACVLPELLLGTCFCKSEGGFDDFISPISNPIFFEDPRNVTEFRSFFWNHNIPAAAGGEHVNLYAVQIRARLTDRLSLVAAKDGYVVSDNPLVDDGWADVSLGLKYGLYRNAREQRLLSARFRVRAAGWLDTHPASQRRRQLPPLHHGRRQAV